MDIRKKSRTCAKVRRKMRALLRTVQKYADSDDDIAVMASLSFRTAAGFRPITEFCNMAGVEAMDGFYARISRLPR